jgi:hypothetical protein
VLMIPKIHLTAMAAVCPWRPLDAAFLQRRTLDRGERRKPGAQA